MEKVSLVQMPPLLYQFNSLNYVISTVKIYKRTRENEGAKDI